MGRPLLMETFRKHPGLMDQMVKNIAARKRANTPVLDGDARAHASSPGEAPPPVGLLERLRQWLHIG